jgi:diguanylate cyclase (GGDEF)-like protein/PAS domain S-box-containing protein
MAREIETRRQQHILSRMMLLSRAAAACGAAVGVIVLLGWALDVPVVKSLGPHLASMKANTALTIFLAGVSLWCLSDESRPKWKSQVGYGCAILLSLIGVLTLSEMAFHLDFGIDGVLFADHSAPAGMLAPSRMGINTAICITLLGFSLLLMDRGKIGRRCSQMVSVFTGTISLYAVIGYVFSVRALYSIYMFSGMAIHTAITFLVLSLGVLLARPASGFMSAVSRDDASGALVRKLLPIALVVPTAAGWLRWEAQQAGFLDTETSIILLSAFNTLCLIAFIYVGTRLLNRLVNQARASEARFRSLLEATPDGIVVVNDEDKIVLVNTRAEEMFGYSRNEMLEQAAKMLLPGKPPESLVKQQHDFFLNPRAIAVGAAVELDLMRRDGMQFRAEMNLRPLETKEGVVVLSAIRDITGRKQIEDELRRSDEKLRLLLSGVKDYAILMLDPEGRVTTWNEGAERIKGYKAEEIIGQHFSKFYTPEAIADGHPAKELKAAVEHGRYEEEGWRVRKDGTRFFANVVITPIRDPQGQLRGFGKVTRDITERNEAQEALFDEKERAQVTLNSIGDAVICTDISGRITFLNLVAERMTGWLLAEAVGRPMGEVLKIVGAASREVIPDPMALAVSQNRTMALPDNCLLIRRNGFEIPIEDSLSPIHNREGATTGAVIVFRDMSAARTMALEMAHSARHDFLTGLPNRMLIEDRVSQAIILGGRHRNKVALLFLDLDGFKHINDSLGHAIGDKLLRSVAERLCECVRGSDTVGRLGGDEFLVLLSEIGLAESAAISARKLLAAVTAPHAIDGHDLHVTTSIGISVYPDDGLDAQTLIKNADTAMYQAKENGRQSCRFFRPEMNVRAVERQSIEEDLRRASERNEFCLHYQPKVDLKTGRITGAEALLRWTHPVRGAVPPAEFILVAEACGLIVPIGRWVLREACKQAQSWAQAGLPPLTMAVNTSAMEFRTENFLDGVLSIIEGTGINPASVELELTETVLMKHVDSTKSVLKTLRGRGVHLAVDDFGTGYSSLSYLRKFPVDTLKIDQSFVRQITTDRDQATLVTAIIALGRSLGLRVVAEGVETEAELRFLKAHHCDEAQGYYFSRPLPAAQFAALLSSRSQLNLVVVPA